mgnify:CR=1 FL=1
MTVAVAPCEVAIETRPDEPIAVRSAIDRLQAKMQTMDTVDLPVTNHFADGLYARELFMPADSLAVGKVHAKSHFLVVLSGEVTAWTDEGMRTLTAGEVVRTSAGTKRVAYAHTDTRLITFHATQETDIALIEGELITPELLEYHHDMG